MSNIYDDYGRLAYQVEIHRKLGQGRFGCKVFRGEDLQTGDTVAIKRFPRNYHDEDFNRECVALQKASGLSDCIVSTFDCYYPREDGHAYICMEYCERGNLRQYLDENRGSISPAIAKRIFQGIAKGLQTLHSHRIYHCDVKPENILLQYNRNPQVRWPWVKLGDFGVAKLLNRYGECDDNTLGTIAYMPPEALFHRSFSEKTDIFSLGILLYEMLEGSRPWLRRADRQEEFERFYSDHRRRAPIPFPPNASHNLRVLITGMLEVDPDNRFDWDDIRASPLYYRGWQRESWD